MQFRCSAHRSEPALRHPLWRHAEAFVFLVHRRSTLARFTCSTGQSLTPTRPRMASEAPSTSQRAGSYCTRFPHLLDAGSIFFKGQLSDSIPRPKIWIFPIVRAPLAISPGRVQRIESHFVLPIYSLQFWGRWWLLSRRTEGTRVLKAVSSRTLLSGGYDRARTMSKGFLCEIQPSIRSQF